MLSRRPTLASPLSTSSRVYNNHCSDEYFVFPALCLTAHNSYRPRTDFLNLTEGRTDLGWQDYPICCHHPIIWPSADLELFPRYLKAVWARKTIVLTAENLCFGTTQHAVTAMDELEAAQVCCWGCLLVALLQLVSSQHADFEAALAHCFVALVGPTDHSNYSYRLPDFVVHSQPGSFQNC